MRSWPWLFHSWNDLRTIPLLHWNSNICYRADCHSSFMEMILLGGTNYFESRFRENYLPDVVGGIIFTDPYFQQLASTCRREHLNMVKSGYGLNIDHWSQFYFMAPSLLLALPSHLVPGQKREKMWWRTENCRKNGGKIFSITFLLLMWLVCNGGEA